MGAWLSSPHVLQIYRKSTAALGGGEPYVCSSKVALRFYLVPVKSKQQLCLHWTCSHCRLDSINLKLNAENWICNIFLCLSRVVCIAGCSSYHSLQWFCNGFSSDSQYQKWNKQYCNVKINRVEKKKSFVILQNTSRFNYFTFPLSDMGWTRHISTNTNFIWKYILFVAFIHVWVTAV